MITLSTMSYGSQLMTKQKGYKVTFAINQPASSSTLVWDCYYLCSSILIFSVTELPFSFCISAMRAWEVCVWHWMWATWWTPTNTTGNWWSFHSNLTDTTPQNVCLWSGTRLTNVGEHTNAVSEVSQSQLQVVVGFFQLDLRGRGGAVSAFRSVDEAVMLQWCL